MFVGDPDQVPLTGYGEFFKQALAYFPSNHITNSKHLNSQHIASAALSVLGGQKPTENTDVTRIGSDFDEIASYANRNESIVLCATDKTAIQINKRIQRLRVKPDFTIASLLNQRIYTSDRLVFTESNHTLGYKRRSIWYVYRC